MSQQVDIAPLGSNIASIASAPVSESAMVLRFMLQNEAANLLPEERVSKCLRWIAPVHLNMGEQSQKHDHVDISYDSARNIARYRNLIVCGSVWACPVCASRISAIRRKVITDALNTSGLYCSLATFTLSHHKRQSLEYTLSALLEAYRKLKSGRWWQGFKLSYGWVGDIRALEITYGANGFHPHIHAIMCFDAIFDEITLIECENSLKVRFEGILSHSGAYASREHSVKMTDDFQEVRDYISKFGKMPKMIKTEGWTIENELTSGHTKTARTKDAVTPWVLLLLSTDGDKQAGEIFREYYRTVKGRNQLVWSRGFQARLGVDITLSAAENTENSAPTVGEIDKYEWYKICALRLRGSLLQKVKDCHGDLQLINEWLIEQLKEIE
jgi:hypothetical protein